jgi:FkbM family methyltransferase
MIRQIEGTSIKFDIRDDYETDEIVIKEIFKENVYEVNSERFAVDGVTIDLGANIGAFALLAASHGSKVYAVEPEPHNLEAMKNNITLSGLDHLVTSVPYGISNFKGTAVIDDNGGGSTIKDDGAFGANIEIISLDGLFALYNIEKVNVLKIDVEGSEVEIILGASKETLNKCKYITMEFDIRSGNQLGAMTQKLSETHHVRTMGSWERGGMVWAWLY